MDEPLTAITLLSAEQIAGIVRKVVREELAAKPTIIKNVNRNEDTDFLTKNDLCQMYKLTQSTIARLQAEGILKVHKIGRRNYYRQSQIEQAMIATNAKYELKN